MSEYRMLKERENCERAKRADSHSELRVYQVCKNHTFQNQCEALTLQTPPTATGSPGTPRSAAALALFA